MCALQAWRRNACDPEYYCFSLANVPRPYFLISYHDVILFYLFAGIV